MTMTVDRLTLLIWGNTFPRMGGVERFVDNLAHGLTARGHEVMVISDGKKSETLRDRPFLVETIPMAEPILSQDASEILKSAQLAKRTITAFQPDVIHYNSSALEMLIFAMSAMRTGLPIATSLHFDLNNPLLAQNQGTFAKVIQASSRITSVSSYVHSLLPKVDYLSEREVDLIENALPMAGSYLPPPNGKVILCLGRLVHEKGFDQVISAMPAILNAHPDARFLIGGRGPEAASYQEKISAAELAENVKLLGWIKPEDVFANMQAADIIAFPSRWEEPFGLVASEAAIAGRPCVAFKVGGIADNIEAGVTGELVEPANIEDFANKINALLSSPETSAAQGLNAYERYGNGERFEIMLDHYEALFQEIKANRDQLSDA